LYNMLLSL